MRGLFKRTKKVTADTARRLTGISFPLGGLQWADPGPGDGELVRRFLVGLEDRRVLYNAMDLEVVSQVHRSIEEIRRQCTEALQSLPAQSFGASPIRAIRAACRRFQDDQHEDFRFFEAFGHRSDGAPGFFVALGAFRATVGYQVALLAAHYDLDIEGELASVLPHLEDEK